MGVFLRRLMKHRRQMRLKHRREMEVVHRCRVVSMFRGWRFIKGLYYVEGDVAAVPEATNHAPPFN